MVQKTLRLYRNSFSGFSREIWLLSGVMLINRSGTMVIPFLTVYLTQIMTYSLGQAGWVMSCFGAGSVLGSYLGGRLTDRIGYYQTQFWSLLLSGMALIGLAYVESFIIICLWVFMISTIADAFRPANFAAIAAYSKAENRTRALALLRMAINLGWAVGPAVGGLLAVQLGYYWLFWVDGLTCIAAALFFRLALPERNTSVESAEEEEPAGTIQYPAHRNRRYLFFLLMVVFNAIAFMQLFASLPVFFKQEIGLSEGQIGQLIGMNGLLIALLEMPLIYVIEKRFSIARLISIGTLLIGLAYLLFNLFGPVLGSAFACMLLLTFGEMLSLPFLATMALGFTNNRNRGQYMALFTMAYSIAHVAAPNVGLQTADNFGFPTLWWLLMGFCLMVWGGFTFFIPREN